MKLNTAHRIYFHLIAIIKEEKLKILPSQNSHRPLAGKRQSQKWRFVNMYKRHEHLINNDKNNTGVI